MERRLAAIMALDMVGYSARMEADEAGTLARHKACRLNRIDPSIALFNGRIVKDIGDGLLVEFASVVDAVRCAVDIQAELAPGTDASDADPLTYRIGINLGDVIHEDGDVFGDGVNIAARLEALAEPGGIVISGTAYDHLKANVDVGYEFLGERALKNITTPVRLYRVVPQSAGKVMRRTRFGLRRSVLAACAALLVLVVAEWWIARPDFVAADPARMALPLPDGPSIAVLPFAFVGPEPEANGYLADGLSESIIGAMTRIPDMVVIDRSSSFSLKGQDMDARSVSERFGVRHVLDGSVQVSGDDLRVSVQLVDAISGRSVWVRKFDGQVTDIFDFQDEIALELASSVYGQTIVGTGAGFIGSRNLDAWALGLEGWAQWQQYTPEGNLQARATFENAIAIDPKFSAAQSGLAATYFAMARFGWTDDPVPALNRAVELCQASLELPVINAGSFTIQAGSLVLLKRPDEARDVMQRGLEALPASADIAAFSGWVLKYIGDAEAAMPHFSRAKRLQPVPQWWVLAEEILTLFDLGQFEQALIRLCEARKIWPPAYEPHYFAWLALAQDRAGQTDAAQQSVATAFGIDPALSVSALGLLDLPYVDPAIPARRHAMFRKLGIPQSPAGN